jgi:hypothetical protein
MRLKLTAAALSMSCSLALASCGEPKRIVTQLAPPSERLQCVSTGARPIIPPEYAIDWSRVLSVPQAHSEHDAYVRSVRTREGVVAGYIVDIEGKLFACSNNAAWLREWYAATAAPKTP